MIEQIKQALEIATHGADWTNFDDRNNSKTVYEYDRLTESTCAIIAQCENQSIAELIANAPEWLRYLIGEVERKDKELKELQESYQVTNADYKSLMDIMNRARKLAFIASEVEEKPIFKMVDGCLTRIEDGE